MGKTNTRETTVDEAALELGVTTRSILNYIKLREIDALKVGKLWFINKASLDAFKQKHGFTSHANAAVNDTDTELKSETPSAKPEKFSKTRGPNLKREKREIYPVHSLRLFQIAHETLHSLNVQTLLPQDRPDLHRKFLTLKMEALEFLGAGFYAFGSRNKALLYGRSREKVGGMLSLAYFYQHEQNKTAKEILKIEEELMPAFSSLIRKIEKKNERT